MQRLDLDDVARHDPVRKPDLDRAFTDRGRGRTRRSRTLIRDRDRHEPVAPNAARNRFRKQLTPPGEQLARGDAVIAGHLRGGASRPRRFRDDPKLLILAPAPPPPNRFNQFDRHHRAMPIVTISTAPRANSQNKTRQPSQDARIASGIAEFRSEEAAVDRARACGGPTEGLTLGVERQFDQSIISL